MKRLIVTYGVIVLLSLAVPVALECALRWRSPEQVASTPDYAFLQSDALLGYSIKSGVRAEFQRTPVNGGERIHWHSNSYGYRGDEPMASPAYRVVVYGDSNIQGVFSSDDNTFAEQLERLLSSAGRPRLEAINAGVVGYGPDHYLLAFERDLARLRPDVAIFTIFADNDLGDPIRHRLLELRGGELSTRSDRFIYPELPIGQRLSRSVSELLLTRTLLGVLERLAPTHDASDATTESSSGNADPSAAYLTSLNAMVAEAHGLYLTRAPTYARVDHYDIDVAVSPASATAELKLAILRAILRRAQRRATEERVKLLVVIIPSRIDMTTHDVLSYRSLIRFPMYRQDRLTGVIESLCVDEGVDVLNLFPIFSASDPASLYFKGSDNHWNDKGQHLAATAVSVKFRGWRSVREAGPAPGAYTRHNHDDDLGITDAQSTNR